MSNDKRNKLEKLVDSFWNVAVWPMMFVVACFALPLFFVVVILLATILTAIAGINDWLLENPYIYIAVSVAIGIGIMIYIRKRDKANLAEE